MLNWDDAYKSGMKFTPVSEIVLDDIFDVLQDKNTKLKTALDVGCGTGELMTQIESHGLKARGIDLSTYSADITGNFLKEDSLGMIDVIFANKVIAFNNTDEFVKKVAVYTNIFVCISPVTLKKYSGKYNKHLLNISTPKKELLETLGKYFDTVDILSTRYFDDFGCELTIICQK